METTPLRFVMDKYVKRIQTRYMGVSFKVLLR
jgi:hypothetical protein